MTYSAMQAASTRTQCRDDYAHYHASQQALHALDRTQFLEAVPLYNQFQKSAAQLKKTLSLLPEEKYRCQQKYTQLFRSTYSTEVRLFKKNFPILFDPQFERCRSLEKKYQEALRMFNIFKKSPSLLDKSKDSFSFHSTEAILHGITLSEATKLFQLHKKMLDALKKIDNSAPIRTLLQSRYQQLTSQLEPILLKECLRQKACLFTSSSLLISQLRTHCESLTKIEDSLFSYRKPTGTVIGRRSGSTARRKLPTPLVLQREVEECQSLKEQMESVIEECKKAQSILKKLAAHYLPAHEWALSYHQDIVKLETHCQAFETPVLNSSWILTFDPFQDVPIAAPRISLPLPWKTSPTDSPFLTHFKKAYPSYRSVPAGPNSLLALLVYAYLSKPEQIKRLKTLLEDWRAPDAISKTDTLDCVKTLSTTPNQLDEALAVPATIHCIIHYFRQLAASRISSNPSLYPIPGLEEKETPIFPDNGTLVVRPNEKLKKFINYHIKHMGAPFTPIIGEALADALAFPFEIYDLEQKTHTKFLGSKKEQAPLATFALSKDQLFVLYKNKFPLTDKTKSVL